MANFRASTPLPSYMPSFLGGRGSPLNNTGPDYRGRFAGGSSIAPIVPPDSQGNCPEGYWPPIAGQCFPQAPPYTPPPGVPCAPGYYLNTETGMCELESTRPKGGTTTTWLVVGGVGLAAAVGGFFLLRRGRRGRR